MRERARGGRERGEGAPARRPESPRPRPGPDAINVQQPRRASVQQRARRPLLLTTPTPPPASVPAGAVRRALGGLRRVPVGPEASPRAPATTTPSDAAPRRPPRWPRPRPSPARPRGAHPPPPPARRQAPARLGGFCNDALRTPATAPARVRRAPEPADAPALPDGALPPPPIPPPAGAPRPPNAAVYARVYLLRWAHAALGLEDDKNAKADDETGSNLDASPSPPSALPFAWYEAVTRVRVKATVYLDGAEAVLEDDWISPHPDAVADLAQREPVPTFASPALGMYHPEARDLGARREDAALCAVISHLAEKAQREKATRIDPYRDVVRIEVEAEGGIVAEEEEEEEEGGEEEEEGARRRGWGRGMEKGRGGRRRRRKDDGGERVTRHARGGAGRSHVGVRGGRAQGEGVVTR